MYRYVRSIYSVMRTDVFFFPPEIVAVFCADGPRLYSRLYIDYRRD